MARLAVAFRLQYWAPQTLPFQDGASYPGFVEMESAVYRSIEN